MSQRLHTYTEAVADSRGVRYRVHAYGERDSGTWTGWLLFEPESGGVTALRTDRETTQADRRDLEYWASGLEPVYLEGALARARPV